MKTFCHLKNWHHVLMFLFKNEVMLNSLMWIFGKLNINCNLGLAKNLTMMFKVLFFIWENFIYNPPPGGGKYRHFCNHTLEV